MRFDSNTGRIAGRKSKRGEGRKAQGIGNKFHDLISMNLEIEEFNDEFIMLKAANRQGRKPLHDNELNEADHVDKFNNYIRAWKKIV